MKNSKVTIEEIAQAAGVSIATVSRIINHKDTVKPDTRKKVMDAIERLNFEPKANTALSTAKSNVIVMCVPDFENPFNSPVIEGVEKAALLHNYDVLLFHSRDQYANTNPYTNILKANSVAGMLLLSPAPKSSFLEELCFRCPVVMCSEYTEDYGTSYVSIDDVAAAKTAVNYLISTGRKKIGFLNCNKDFKYARHREKGYREALQEAKLEINEDWIAHLSSINYNLAVSMALHILRQPNRPDALFTCSDVFAVAAINAAKKLGLNVPNDISVVGFDNIELSIMSDPPITTIEQPAYQIGFQACELLIEKIKNPNTTDKQIILDTQLIVRNSTSYNTQMV